MCVTIFHRDDSSHLQELKFHPPLLHVNMFNSKRSKMVLAELPAGQIKMKYNNKGLPIFEFLQNLFLPHPPKCLAALSKDHKDSKMAHSRCFSTSAPKKRTFLKLASLVNSDQQWQTVFS